MTGSWGGGAAGWRMAARITAGNDRLSLGMLAQRFPRFAFGTRRMRDHVAFEAVRHDRDEPGVYAVITRDLGEMREALIEAESSPPAGGGQSRGGG